MRIRTSAAVLLMCGVLASSAEAQCQPSQPPSTQTFIDADGLSLDQAVARGLAQEPSLRGERTTIEVARGMRRQAGARRNPAVAMEQREEPTGADRQTVASVEWPLDLFRRRGRVAVADRQIAVAESSIAERERALAADVRTRYGEVVAGVRELSVLEELIAAVRRQHDLLRARVETGSAPPLERDLLQVELRRLEADRLLLLGEVDGTVFELKRVLGMPPDEPLRLRDALEEVVTRESTATGGLPGDSRVDDRADVKAAEARVELAEARVDLAQRDGRFDVSLVGGYMRMVSAFPQFGVSESGVPERVGSAFNFATLGATLTIPLFDRKQGDIAAARAERTGAAAELEAARLSAETEVAAARIRDLRAQEAVKLYGTGVRALARENLTVFERSAELGRTTVFEVMAEQRRYLEIERAYTDALRTAFEARTALKRALGDLP